MHRATPSRLAQATQLLSAIEATLADPKRRIALNVLELTGTWQGWQVPYDRLAHWEQGGHSAHLRAEMDDFLAELRFGPGGTEISPNAPIIDTFEGQTRQDLERACADDDWRRFLVVCEPQLVSARLTIRNADADMTGVHWIATREALIAMFRESWVGLACELFKAGKRATVMVDDIGDSSLMTADLRIGRDFDPDWHGTEAVDWLERSRQRFAPRIIPAPQAFYPREASNAEDIAAVCRSAASGLAWVWLADAVDLEGGVRASFSTFDAELTELPGAEGAEDAIALWRQRFESSDPSAEEAIRQSLAVVCSEAKELPTSAGKTLALAKVIQRATNAKLLAEALNSYRGAAQSAVAMATSVSAGCREATKTMRDSIIALAASGVALTLATSNSKLTTRQAFFFAAVAALSGGLALTLTAYVNLSGAQRQVDGLLSDVNVAFPTLTSSDRRRVDSLASMAAARAELARAKLVVGLLAGACWLAFVGLGGYAAFFA